MLAKKNPILLPMAALLLLPMLSSAPAQAQRLPEGTVVKVRLLDDLNSETARVGDRVRVQVADTDRSGLPLDSVFVGRVTEARRASKSAPGVINLSFGALERAGGWQPVSGGLHSLDDKFVREDASGRLVGKRGTSDKERQKFLGYGAAGGALLGYVLGDDLNGALKGGLLGAVAGYLYGESQKKKQQGYQNVDLKEGAEFGIYLNRPVTLRDSVAQRL